MSCSTRHQGTQLRTTNQCHTMSHLDCLTTDFTNTEISTDNSAVEQTSPYNPRSGSTRGFQPPATISEDL